MFTELQNQVWTASAGATIEDNTDTKIDLVSSKKVTFTDADDYVEVEFDEITLEDFEEISLWIQHQKRLDLAGGEILRITVDGEDFDFPPNLREWEQVLIDCEDLGPVTTIRFTALVAGLVLFIDYPGVRVTNTDTMDTEVLDAFKNRIALDYGVSTTLSAAASVGASSISITDSRYVFNTTRLRLTEGATSEDVNLINSDGGLRDDLENSFTTAAEVEALCPTEIEDIGDMEPDPICGIVVFDKSTMKEDETVTSVNNARWKQHLGALGVMVYIDCSSKLKVLELSRQFDRLYGDRFQILLDGEPRDVYLDSSNFSDTTSVGNNPRMAYSYRVDPAPVLYARRYNVTDLELTPQSEGTE